MNDCGTCHPPPDGSPDREAIDRFRDFLKIVGEAPVVGTTEDGKPIYQIPHRAYRYATGEDIAPIDPEES